MPLLPRSCPLRSGQHRDHPFHVQLDITEFLAGADVTGLGTFDQFAILHVPIRRSALALSHSARSLPLNSWMASDGGVAQPRRRFHFGGTGDQNSVSSAWAAVAAEGCARAGSGRKTNNASSFSFGSKLQGMIKRTVHA